MIPHMQIYTACTRKVQKIVFGFLTSIPSAHEKALRTGVLANEHVVQQNEVLLYSLRLLYVEELNDYDESELSS